MIKHNRLILGLLFAIITFGFSIISIKNFTVPLMGWVGIGPFFAVNHDFVGIQEYTGFYLAKNLEFNLFPNINLVTDQSFYPYGINGVFQPWSLEKDLFYAVFYSFFGLGPWLQIYYLLSLLITAIGSFILLYIDYGTYRAAGVSFLVSFGNFYSIHKYPHHLTQAAVHWVILSIIVDFLIVKRIVFKRHIPLLLILTRLALLFLLLGLELGYVTGFALMSFTVSLLFLIILLSYRFQQHQFNIREVIDREKRRYKKELKTYPRLSFILLATIIISVYLYFPLALQIAINAKQFDFQEIIVKSYWTNPLRLFIPFFPIINPGKKFDTIFRDSPESFGAGSPGWFLLIIGVMGLWQSRRQLLQFVPFLIVFVLCLLYHPVLFPTLKIFPWFLFNRVAGRSTTIYAVILAIFALHINIRWLSSYKKKLLAILLVFLAIIEIGTAYSFRREYQPYIPNQSFYNYINYVKDQPGEAVLDWPFCATGSGFKHKLCPYYFQTSGIFTLRRFHEKKVMGQYFGRLHPSQAQPYIEAGWDKLFFPDARRKQQKRCFNDKEWLFFTEFFKLNDFAGISLYIDLLPKECLDEFYQKLGNPAVETVIPEAGRVQFIPKSSEFRQQVNPELGSRLQLNSTFIEDDTNLE